eukprot:417573_1
MESNTNVIVLKVSVKGFNNKRIKINKHEMTLKQLKQAIVNKFDSKNIKEPFNILTKEEDEESEWEIDSDDICDLKNKQKIWVQLQKKKTLTPHEAPKYNDTDDILDKAEEQIEETAWGYVEFDYTSYNNVKENDIKAEIEEPKTYVCNNCDYKNNLKHMITNDMKCINCTVFNNPVESNKINITPSRPPSSTKQQWNCVACTFTNDMKSSQCEMCATKKNDDNEAKNNVIDLNDYVFNSDDIEQEVVVNSSDQRTRANGSSIHPKNILKCIGFIKSLYMDKEINNGKSFHTRGSGTVYKVNEGYAYVISCAHNFRFIANWKCNTCNIKNKKRQCSQCDNKSATATIVKASKFFFERRDLSNGDREQNYQCDMVYIPDSKYSALPLGDCGYDIAIVRFKDLNNYYKENCKDILLVNGKLLHSIRDSQNKHSQFYIYGYPQKVFNDEQNAKTKIRKEMWGGVSVKNTFNCEVNTFGNGQTILTQNVIDATPGASGSPIFSIYFEKYTLIFAVHTGGNKTLQYNVGTLIDKTIDYLKVSGDDAKSSDIRTIQDLINDSQQRYVSSLTNIRNFFIYKKAHHSEFNMNKQSNQICNIGMVLSRFGDNSSAPNYLSFRSTGFIIKHSPKYAYLLTAKSAVIHITDKTNAHMVSFELLANTKEEWGYGDSVATYGALNWIAHESSNIAVIKISDPKNKLFSKIKSLNVFTRFNEYNNVRKGIVVGYNSHYGQQLFGMIGNIECLTDIKQIQYHNIVWSGAGAPIFGFDAKENDENSNVKKKKIFNNKKISLVEKLIRRGLHIDAILKALDETDYETDIDIYNHICAGGRYKPSNVDKEIYNAQDSNYQDIFGCFENAVIGVDAGINCVFLTEDLLQWILHTCSNM